MRRAFVKTVLIVALAVAGATQVIRRTAVPKGAGLDKRGHIRGHEGRHEAEIQDPGVHGQE